MTYQDLETMFDLDPPTADQTARMDQLRSAGKHLAMLILHNTPACPEQEVAIRRVREAIWTANSAIAYNERHATR